MTGTYMQRVFDVLRGAPERLSVDDLARQTELDAATVKEALLRLRRGRLLTPATMDDDRVWRYAVKANAQRPSDGRGRRRAGEARA